MAILAHVVRGGLKGKAAGIEDIQEILDNGIAAGNQTAFAQQMLKGGSASSAQYAMALFSINSCVSQV